MINGFPKEFFEGNRGIRQGDPFYPYEFIIAVEILSRMVKKAENCGMLEGFSTNDGNPRVPFIQFADDSLFLLNDDPEEFRNLRCIVLILETISGLKVNLRKSKLFLVGDLLNLEALSSIMGCKMEALPTTYLGLSLGGKSSSKAIWNSVIKRLERRLSSWKGSYLSKGCNLVLLRSVLSSPPTYFLSLFVAPKSISNKIEQMQRNFLWQNELGVRKIKWVSWEEICNPLDKGGLGIRPIRFANRALFHK